MTVTLMDDQSFTGKLVELPKVPIPVTVEERTVTVPLERIALLERTTPGGRLY